MESGKLSLAAGDYLTPGYDHARVEDAMRPGVFTCAAGTPLRMVARLMATNHVHSVIVSGRRVDESGHVGDRPWAIVTDVDLLRAADSVDDLDAAAVATHELHTVNPETPLRAAAERMARERISHLVVVDGSGEAIGVLSSLDVAGNLAWARG